MTNAEIITSFREHLRTLPRPAATAENPDPKIVCVVDSIVSNPGILLPWQEMVKICQEEGVYSVVDAAHSIGQEMNINLEETQPDFWFSVRRSGAEECPELKSRRRTVINGYMRSAAVPYSMFLKGS